MLAFNRVDFDEAERIRKQAMRDRANVIGGAIVKAARAVLRGLGRIAEAFAEARRQEALYAQLSRMSDRELRDAGINRADIPAVVAGTLTRGTDRREPEAADTDRAGADRATADRATADRDGPAQADERLAA